MHGLSLLLDGALRVACLDVHDRVVGDKLLSNKKMREENP
jgi:hypothetical protein